MHGAGSQEQRMQDHLAQLGPVLCECAVHVTEGSFDKTDCSLRKIRELASIVDGPLQRLSLIIADSLFRRLLRPMQGFASALIDPSRYLEKWCLRVARNSFASISPYLATGFVTINRAILEQVQDKQVVRIIDLSGSTTHQWQWLKILHDFHGRPGGPPELRLTVVHEDSEFLDYMQTLLSKQAGTLMPSFHFDKVVGRLEALDFSNLREILKINFGEAVVISCALQMHRLLAVDDDDDASRDGIAQLQQMANKAHLKQMMMASSPRSTLSYPQTPSPQRQIPKLLVSFLSAVRALKPNIVVMMEQEADHNAPLFRERFAEMLRYYAALFDSLNAAAAGREDDERARVERVLLREEIKNMLVCEGAQRHERHEKLSQWEMHMNRCEFQSVPLSFDAIREGKEKMMSSGLKECRGIEEDKHRLLLSWGETHLYSVSAWRPRG
ncbi:scarecrow-like protein 3 isoform X2 [Brachypodium distachyon]|uniref:Uncharacterized protein n=1 Tax=Brachypodium distachyon TaxID=15368 RepID=A0A0Q3EQ72_BRADI|nr:scarecrow-like protein 3 isoform X2 [Brachypodium distachyon]KQJ89574.1 hypothetical protein BRADI_4g26520v3 [Brachypodium distachyon]KQJ89575.1 hypothetical protein BRADI_4g26520v3 [Brachypodium distachyon]PNT64241.1 hypothetical protein BRADI_4g26520v3 [Brachypodium distachyon]PNT64242.1 hypothetical protein BRADI_4g26520v3 [Brachypodium distachyon]PNT64243.1 hypothetical protein BRADI_4g26520v3 [Brachypodium distachyon]|eukprot:XP_003576356.2 scarecrow-like protein 3 isoform X2 [Brachypodium distachyon]